MEVRNQKLEQQVSHFNYSINSGKINGTIFLETNNGTENETETDDVRHDTGIRR